MLTNRLSYTRTLLLAALVAMPIAAANAETFQITIENLSNNVLTPAPFITHNASFDLFNAGSPASVELEALAEDGMFAGVIGLASAAMGTSVTDYAVAGAAPIGPGSSATVTLTTDNTASCLSFASMLAFSNDAFIGGAHGDGAIDLFPGGSPFYGNVMIMADDVWDAGTEVNDELAANVPALGGSGSVDEFGTVFRPHAGLGGLGDVPRDRNWTDGAVARISIVPEPSTLAMLGFFGLALCRKRERS